MGRHCQPVAKRWRPYVTTGIALQAATLFAFAYATDSHVMLDSRLAATTSIFVDGTKSITGSEEGISPYRMADSFQGRYGPIAAGGLADQEKFVVYPRSLGPLTGLGDPTYDASEGIATQQVVDYVKTVRSGDATGTIYVVGYSQGAGAAVEAMKELESQGLTKDVVFVLAANPRRNDGGILARLPQGAYLPIIGVTFGGGTSPQSPDTEVVQVTKQYDGVGDAPKYILNVAADANAILGFVYLHPGYYKNIDSTIPGTQGAIVTHSADGRITDVLIPAASGQLPLTMPLLQLGVPQDVVTALDPFLRAVIETGYDRPTGSDPYPAKPVPFQLMPPPTRWISDVQSVAAGGAQTLQALTGSAPANPSVATTTDDNVTASSVTEPESSVIESEQKPAPKPSSAIRQKPASNVVSALTKNLPSPRTAPSPRKFQPPRQPKAGWKPGDLMRSVLDHQPTGKKSTRKESSEPPATATESNDTQGAHASSAPQAD